MRVRSNPMLKCLFSCMKRRINESLPGGILPGGRGEHRARAGRPRRGIGSGQTGGVRAELELQTPAIENPVGDGAPRLARRLQGKEAAIDAGVEGHSALHGPPQPPSGAPTSTREKRPQTAGARCRSAGDQLTVRHRGLPGALNMGDLLDRRGNGSRQCKF
jgi:hypothetical protein